MSEQLEQQPTQQQSAPKTALSTKAAIAYLAEKFPLCFTLEGEAKPLKIGLFQDLAQALEGDENISKTVLRQTLRAYTMSWRYLHACKEGAVRVDLQGAEAGVIDAQQAEHAANSLAESKAAYSERRAQQIKEERKAFFKQKAREESAKKRAETRNSAPKASIESLTALESKFSKGKK
ncbi:RNA chaperone ProQ [Pasteurellaceae bacterium Macca]|nr:RNA chaperone ProQ [Pasteurellaceae bacterium Macca]